MYGEIPVDSEGRSYDIHHIDGDKKNHDPSNLIALTIEEHFWMHWLQADYKACHAILLRKRYTKEQVSAFASAANLQRVQDGTNPFCGPSINRKRVRERTHHFLGGAQSRKNAIKLVEEGRHPFSGGGVQSASNRKRVIEGTHNFLGGKIQKRQLEEGTHNFQRRKKCPWCGYENNLGNVAIHMRVKHGRKA